MKSLSWRNSAMIILLSIMVAVGVIGCIPSDTIPTVTVTEINTPITVTETPEATPTEEVFLPSPVPTEVDTEIRGCNRLAPNVNGFEIADYQYFKQVMVSIQPCTLLIMDDAKRALELMQLLPNTLIVFRKYHVSDGGQCWVQSGKSQVDTYIAELEFVAREIGMPSNSYQKIALYGCSNEPHVGTDSQLRELIQFERDFMAYARSKGVTPVSGNWAVGTINPRHVEEGFFHDYLIDVDRYGAFIGVHEYTTYCLCFGVGYMSRADLLDPAKVQPSTWPHTIQTSRIFPSQSAGGLGAGYESLISYYNSFSAQSADGYLPPNWHLFRSIWLVIYAKEHGLPVPTFIITEGLHDRLDDIRIVGEGEINPVVWLQDNFGMGNRFYFGDIRGVPSHCRLWEEFYYPNLTCAEATMMQWAWWDMVAPGNYLGVHIFTWSQNSDWTTFNIDGTSPVGYELHALWIDYTNRLLTGETPEQIFNSYQTTP